MQLNFLQAIVSLLLVVHIKNLHKKDPVSFYSVGMCSATYLDELECDHDVVTRLFGLEHVRELALAYSGGKEER